MERRIVNFHHSSRQLAWQQALILHGCFRRSNNAPSHVRKRIRCDIHLSKKLVTTYSLPDSAIRALEAEVRISTTTLDCHTQCQSPYPVSFVAATSQLCAAANHFSSLPSFSSIIWYTFGSGLPIPLESHDTKCSLGISIPLCVK